MDKRKTEIEIINNPDIPEILKIEFGKTFNNRHNYLGYSFNLSENGLFYKTRKTNQWKLLSEPFTIESMIKLDEKILFTIQENNRIHKNFSIYELSNLLNMKIYKGSLGRRLFREFLYQIGLVYYPNLSKHNFNY